LVSQETKLPKTYQAQCLCSYWLKRAERQVSSKLASRLKMWGIIGSEWAAIRDVSAKSHIFRGMHFEHRRCLDAVVSDLLRMIPPCRKAPLT
jgi:hypothetical protein